MKKKDEEGITLHDGTKIGLDDPASETLAILCMCGESRNTLRELIEHIKNDHENGEQE